MLVRTKKLPKVPGYYWCIRENENGLNIVLCDENGNPMEDFKDGVCAGSIPFPKHSLLKLIDTVFEDAVFENE